MNYNGIGADIDFSIDLEIIKKAHERFKTIKTNKEMYDFITSFPVRPINYQKTILMEMIRLEEENKELK
jgi:hypothetical protein